MSDHVSETIFSSDNSSNNRRGSSVPSWLQHKDTTPTSESTLAAENTETFSNISLSNKQLQSSVFSIFSSSTSNDNFSDNESEFDESSCSDDDFDSPSSMEDVSINMNTTSSAGDDALDSPIWARQHPSPASYKSSSSPQQRLRQQQQRADVDMGRGLTEPSLDTDADMDMDMDMEIASTTDSTSSFNGYSTRTSRRVCPLHQCHYPHQHSIHTLMSPAKYPISAAALALALLLSLPPSQWSPVRVFLSHFPL